MITIDKQVSVTVLPRELAQALACAGNDEQANFFAAFFSYLAIACETEYKFDIQLSCIRDAIPPATRMYLSTIGA
jgi:hypothetical protein